MRKRLSLINKKLPLLRPPAATSISCDAARQIITNLGFEDVKPELCTGDTFSFVAMRNGKSFSIDIIAANGEVKEVPAEALVVVANQVRLQGHKCEKPSAVERDVFLSKPGTASLGFDLRRKVDIVLSLFPTSKTRVTRLD